MNMALRPPLARLMLLAMCLICSYTILSPSRGSIPSISAISLAVRGVLEFSSSLIILLRIVSSMPTSCPSFSSPVVTTHIVFLWLCVQLAQVFFLQIPWVLKPLYPLIRSLM